MATSVDAGKMETDIQL